MIKAVALSALLVSAMTITLLLQLRENMEKGGYAYLNSSYSNGIRNVSAGTIRGNSADFAYLQCDNYISEW